MAGPITRRWNQMREQVEIHIFKIYYYEEEVMLRVLHQGLVPISKGVVITNHTINLRRA